MIIIENAEIKDVIKIDRYNVRIEFQNSISFEIDDIDILEDFEDGQVTHYNLLLNNDQSLESLTPRPSVLAEWKRIYQNAIILLIPQCEGSLSTILSIMKDE